VQPPNLGLLDGDADPEGHRPPKLGTRTTRDPACRAKHTAAEASRKPEPHDGVRVLEERESFAIARVEVLELDVIRGRFRDLGRRKIVTEVQGVLQDGTNSR
jgi:hypothetical protein